jgi:hypothetical protein
VTAFATLEAFAEHRQTDFEPTDVFALRALESASSYIRAALGQTISLVLDDVVTLDGMGRDGLVLPQYPVVEVTDVALLAPPDDPTVLVVGDWYVDSAGILWRSPGTSWPNLWPGWGWPQWGRIQVTYDHGYEVIPDECITLTLLVASRLYQTAQNSAAAGAVTSTSKTIGGATYSVGYATGGNGTVNSQGFTDTEARLLAAYPWPAPVVAEVS